MGNIKALAENKPDEKQMSRVEAIISSMTPDERRKQHIINGSRRKRIAKGSGTSVEEVNRLLKQFVQMQKMLKSARRDGRAGRRRQEGAPPGHADAAQPPTRPAGSLRARSATASSRAPCAAADAKQRSELRSRASLGSSFRREQMVAIRLRRAGSKKRPFFRVVVTDSRAARDSSFVEILGHYNPRTKPAVVEVDKERVDYWLKKGAQPSDSVRTLIARHLTPAPCRRPRRPRRVRR